MNTDLNKLRKNYNNNELLESNLPNNPIKLFHHWFNLEKMYSYNKEVNAMSIATIDNDLSPDVRTVLLKKYSDNGFIFYTNYYSKKGKSIKNNKKVCLLFFWDRTYRQIIIKGKASKLDVQESDKYFKKRPIGHQISSWASKQSKVIISKNIIIKNYKKWKSFFTKHSISRPFYWGGYIVKPYSIEFWQGRPNRLHDRIIYIKNKKNWIINRLSP